MQSPLPPKNNITKKGGHPLLENITNIPNISMGHKLLHPCYVFPRAGTRHVTKWAPSYCNKEPTRCQSCRGGPIVGDMGFSRVCVCPKIRNNGNNRFPWFQLVFCFWGQGIFFLVPVYTLVFTGSGRGCRVGHPKGLIGWIHTHMT